jgi:hypothetical protein
MEEHHCVTCSKTKSLFAYQHDPEQATKEERRIEQRRYRISAHGEQYCEEHYDKFCGETRTLTEAGREYEMLRAKDLKSIPFKRRRNPVVSGAKVKVYRVGDLEKIAIEKVRQKTKWEEEQGDEEQTVKFERPEKTTQDSPVYVIDLSMDRPLEGFGAGFRIYEDEPELERIRDLGGCPSW